MFLGLACKELKLYWKLKASTHEGLFQGHFARVSTHEGAFSSFLNFSRDLASKYLIGLVSWINLWGGNSAPEDELSPEIVGHTEELSSSSVPLEHNPGAKPFVCISLKTVVNSQVQCL